MTDPIFVHYAQPTDPITRCGIGSDLEDLDYVDKSVSWAGVTCPACLMDAPTDAFRYLISLPNMGYRSRPALDAYLGFGATIVQQYMDELKKPIVYGAVIRVATEHARWMSGRLQSGWMGGHTIYETQEAAAAAIEELI